uniref:nuclear nucleic acid-binding protein C1D-like n=1 Tax=Styela clava TaxID=7725 RepID=UPI001939EAE1|nr:nuclear nucleic acid-binding protein C1D-like [Styela clava]
MSSSDGEDIPHELEECFESFSDSLDKVESAIKPLLDTPRNKILQDLTPLDVAKLELVSAYSINSMFWTYLITQGVNPRTHPIKGELDRIKIYMGKVKEIEDRAKAPKLEKETAKRFIRNAMFDLDDKNKEKQEKSDSKGAAKRHSKHHDHKSKKRAKKK